jgi:hypothetical protein
MRVRFQSSAPVIRSRAAAPVGFALQAVVRAGALEAAYEGQAAVKDLEAVRLAAASALRGE